MLLLMMFQLFAADDVGVRYTGADIFDPLARDEVVVTHQGHVYMLNFQEKHVVHFSPEGEMLGTLGREGNGPGEFSFPNRLFADRDHLYVYDMGRNTMSRFKLADDKLVDDSRLSGMGVEFVKCANGWITGNFSDFRNTGEPIQIKWTDEAFKQETEILTMERTGNRGLVARSQGGKKPVIPFNPVRPTPFMSASPDGKFVYVSEGKGLKIHVIDVQAKKEVRLISRDVTAIPFNEEYGDAQLANLKERSGKVTMVDFVPDYPEHFPIVKGFSVSSDGLLVVETWTGDPDNKQSFLVMDNKGSDQTLNYSNESVDRVVAVQNGEAYVLGYHEDDGAYVSKVPVSKVDNVVAGNPITAEAQPRFMMRTSGGGSH